MRRNGSAKNCSQTDPAREVQGTQKMTLTTIAATAAVRRLSGTIKNKPPRPGDWRQKEINLQGERVERTLQRKPESSTGAWSIKD